MRGVAKVCDSTFWNLESFFFFSGNLKSMQVNPTDSRREREREYLGFCQEWAEIAGHLRNFTEVKGWGKGQSSIMVLYFRCKTKWWRSLRGAHIGYHQKNRDLIVRCVCRLILISGQFWSDKVRNSRLMCSIIMWCELVFAL